MQSKLKVLEQKLKRKQKVFYMENVGIFGCNEIDEYMHSLTHSILNERKKRITKNFDLRFTDLQCKVTKRRATNTIEIHI